MQSSGSALRVGSLFSGIGGFDLGFERAGMRTVWVVERDPYCQFVLARWFPHATRYHDVRQVSASYVEPVEVLCGGFPCQDISLGNKTAVGIDGSRSGLWSEFARLIGELRPLYVVIENSAYLSRRGLDRVLSHLAACGYDAEWQCLPARDFGAPHFRDRLFLVAYTRSVGLEGSGREHGLLSTDAWAERRRIVGVSDWWTVEPEPPRVADGFPGRLDKDFKWRVATTGNALVPQIAEWIGQCIMSDYALCHSHR